ncbi:MAG: ABC transporter ATP-binding protein [Anaerolineae bacterium]|nr:ABC transporter ATP-binding protein [Anaerolineae bacterium]MDQ7034384.1 ABC transporter ATP-binding protein [Anaerolineae bacterium]
MSSEFTANSKTAYKSDRRSPTRFVVSHVRRHWYVAVALVIGAFSNAAFQSTVPILIGRTLNKLQDFEAGTITGDAAMQGILVLVGLLIGAQFLRSILQLIRNFSAETFGQRIERDVRDELYANLLGKSMTFHDMQPVGDIMARVTNDVRELYFMMNPGLNMVVGSGMFLVMPLFVAPTIHPQLILTPLLFVILHLIVQIRFILNLYPIAQKVRGSFGNMNSRLAEALDGLEVVKGTAQEENEKERFANLADNVRDYYIQQGEVEARYLSTLLWGLAFVGALIHASILFQAGLIRIGDVVTYIGLIYMFGFPVFVTLFSLSRVASGYASAKRILDIITTETALDQNENGHHAAMKGEIVFDDVTFVYGEGAPVLKHISFTVQPGQTVAIVGQTGSGKSSLTKLINRTYDATEGRVLVDGVDVRDWDLASLRSQIGNIEQDIFLFSRSIAENIAFSDDKASREQIEDAAKKAQAHDFILSFPDGYETKIGQRGVTLSGGQRQRLALARAFESNPPVLILDDSTSAIDSATEDKIQKAIWTAAEGRTTLLITHRLSQIRWADHIIVLKQGKIAAQGKHEELLQTSESYRRIFARYDEPEQQANVIATEQA